MNVKRAVAAAAGVIATLILVVAVGAGYLAGHHSSARPGAGTAAHAAAVTLVGTAHTAAPVNATLDVLIYGDSVNAAVIYGDGLGVSAGTTTTAGGTTTTGSATVGITSGGDVTGVVTEAIYGD